MKFVQMEKRSLYLLHLSNHLSLYFCYFLPTVPLVLNSNIDPSANITLLVPKLFNSFNSELSIVVTLAGIVIVLKVLELVAYKAPDFIVVTPSGIISSVSFFNTTCI